MDIGFSWLFISTNFFTLLISENDIKFPRLVFNADIIVSIVELKKMLIKKNDCHLISTSLCKCQDGNFIAFFLLLVIYIEGILMLMFFYSLFACKKQVSFTGRGGRTLLFYMYI